MLFLKINKEEMYLWHDYVTTNENSGQSAVAQHD